MSDEMPVKSPPAKAKWSLKKKLGVIGGAIVAVFIALVLIVNVATSAPVKVSNALVDNIQANKPVAAYEQLSSGAKDVTNVQTLTDTLNRISPILNGQAKMTSKEIKGETGSAATAKVVYKIHGSDNLTYNLTVNLVKDSGEWKVLNFESLKD